ncbi:MAG: YadA-like family protein, partial [Phascolarctobacterium sp.]|nr:YadA-like family protein [Phascolarctobacterium sp.]
ISLKETAQALAGKADKATTLDGYGITDAYTKAEVDSKLDGKVDAKDVYSKTDVDGKIADVASELDGKADKTYVDSNFAKVSDVYTKEEADATFVKRTELATMDENGNVIAIASRTELNGNFIVEDGVNGTEISINKGTDNQIIIGSDGSMLFGTNSTQIDDNGVFAGRIEMGENDPHNYANAQAAINQDGYIKGASGKFEVNGETGNVIGGTYNGVKLEQNSEGEAIINDVNINQMSEQVVSNYDAITGLNQRLGQMNGKLNKVGAGAAALAALHPLEYDPDDKLTFSAGVGNYAGENAAALGAFYRPDEKLMFSLGGTMGNGENMVNLGVSIGLDGASGTPKLSKKELVQKVNTMEAENQSMKAEIAELKALVAELVAKK